MSTDSTIRIKLGAIEVECTATEDFLKAELPVLMQSMVDMHRAQFSAGNLATSSQEPGNMEPTISENNHGTTRAFSH